jgi:hypothetical protein
MLVAWVWTDRTFYTVVVEDTIDASIEDAWEVLVNDYRKINEYSELVDAVVLEGDQIGLGCVRASTLKDGHYVRDEITQWDPPWKMEIVIRDASMPMVPGTSVVFELREQGSQVHIKATGRYRLKFLGPLSPFFGKSKYQDLVTHLVEIVKIQT